VDDIYSVCENVERKEIKLIRKPGPMLLAVDETGVCESIAFINDPDSI